MRACQIQKKPSGLRDQSSTCVLYSSYADRSDMAADALRRPLLDPASVYAQVRCTANNSCSACHMAARTRGQQPRLCLQVCLSSISKVHCVCRHRLRTQCSLDRTGFNAQACFDTRASAACIGQTAMALCRSLSCWLAWRQLTQRCACALRRPIPRSSSQKSCRCAHVDDDVVTVDKKSGQTCYRNTCRWINLQVLQSHCR